MKTVSTTSVTFPATSMGAVGKAWDEMSASFNRFCLVAGVEALGAMMEKDAEEACGARHARSEGRRGHRWGRTQGKIGFHAGKVAVERPRVRDLAGQELAPPSWERAVAEDWLGKWAMNLMLINVSTRKFRRAVRLPEGDVPAPAGAGVSKSAASRHFVALSAARMKEWMGVDLSGLDITLAKAIRRSFGRPTPIQRCQIHKARNIMERLSPALHASVRRALRQAWELDDAAKAEKLIRNLAQRLERDAPGVAKSILEGLDEILTVSRLDLPAELRRSLACTNIIENMMGTVRRLTRNVKRWSSSSMALRWTAAAMHEAKKGFRRLKAFKQLPALQAALLAHSTALLPKTRRPLNVVHGSARFAKFNKERGNPAGRTLSIFFDKQEILFQQTAERRNAIVHLATKAKGTKRGGVAMPNSGELRARARVLYDFAQSADDWGERVELRFRAIELEAEAEKLEAYEIPALHVIVIRRHATRLRR